MGNEKCKLDDNDNRIPAVSGKENEQGFIISDKDGLMEVELIHVIGAGGSCIAYKATKMNRLANAGIPTACIVKEYYPISRDEYISQIRYERTTAGEEIKLVGEASLTESRFEMLRDYELEKQASNVDREIRISRELNYDELNINNSPYLYKTDDIAIKRSDSSYIIIDTGEGCTLRKHLDNLVRNEDSIKEAIKIIDQILIAADSLLMSRPDGKKYCHGDIKPENIFLEGFELAGGEVIRPKILDFGSVFRYDEYQCNIDDMNNDEIIRAANRIANNEGIGCSSNGYRSNLIGKLARAKDKYIQHQHIDYARDLITSINKVNASADYYSLMQIFMELMIGKPWPLVGRISREEIAEIGGYSEDIIEFIVRTGRKIQRNEYVDMSTIRDDIEELTSLVYNNANPKVLLRQLRNEFGWIKDLNIDERIFGNIN